jgi:hypothetical protein
MTAEIYRCEKHGLVFRLEADGHGAECAFRFGGGKKGLRAAIAWCMETLERNSKHIISTRWK